ncbi:hypothetical protein JCM15908A_17780 [Prevotella dentasini JCM 15908]
MKDIRKVSSYQMSITPKNNKNSLFDIEVFYNALQKIVWGDNYHSKERRVIIGNMRIPEDINPKLIETIKNMLE